MRKLKVYGTNYMSRGKVYRSIVADYNRTAAAKCFLLGVNAAKNYMAESGNKIERSVATAEPHTVFIKVDGEFIRLKDHQNNAV